MPRPSGILCASMRHAKRRRTGDPGGFDHRDAASRALGPQSNASGSGRSATQTANYADLPTETLWAIFRHVGRNDYRAVRGTCAHWRASLKGMIWVDGAAQRARRQREAERMREAAVQNGQRSAGRDDSLASMRLAQRPRNFSYTMHSFWSGEISLDTALILCCSTFQVAGLRWLDPGFAHVTDSMLDLVVRLSLKYCRRETLEWFMDAQAIAYQKFSAEVLPRARTCRVRACDRGAARANSENGDPTRTGALHTLAARRAYLKNMERRGIDTGIPSILMSNVLQMVLRRIDSGRSNGRLFRWALTRVAKTPWIVGSVRNTWTDYFMRLNAI